MSAGKRRIVWFHRASAVLWAVLTVPALLWWKTSILFVIAASIYANVKSDWSAAEAADDSAVLARLDQLDEKIDQLGNERDRHP